MLLKSGIEYTLSPSFTVENEGILSFFSIPPDEYSRCPPGIGGFFEPFPVIPPFPFVPKEFGEPCNFATPPKQAVWAKWRLSHPSRFMITLNSA